MPDTYTAPNGYTVKRDDRGVRIAITTDAGYTSTWIDNPRADAIRAFFLAELGLWHDEETGALVVTGSWNGTAARVVLLDGKCAHGVVDADNPCLYDKIVTRWRATITPPPREPQPGEVWRITLEDGTEQNALVWGGILGYAVQRFVWGPGGVLVDDMPADRRRILVEADGTVVSDE